MFLTEGQLHDLFLLEERVWCRALLKVVLPRLLVLSLAPNVDRTALHYDPRVSTPAADAHNSFVVKDILNLVRCLLVRRRARLLYVAQSQPLKRALAPRVEVSGARDCHAVGDARDHVDDLGLECGLWQAKGHLSRPLNDVRQLFVRQAEPSANRRAHREDAAPGVQHHAMALSELHRLNFIDDLDALWKLPLHVLVNEL